MAGAVRLRVGALLIGHPHHRGSRRRCVTSRVARHGDQVMTLTCRGLSWAIHKFYKTRSGVAEDQRVVILAGLVGKKPHIRAVRRSELVLSSIGDPG